MKFECLRTAGERIDEPQVRDVVKVVGNTPFRRSSPDQGRQTRWTGSRPAQEPPLQDER